MILGNFQKCHLSSCHFLGQMYKKWLPFYLTIWSHWSLHFLSWWCMESSSCFFGLHIIIAATPPSIVLPRSGPRSMTLGIVKNAVRDDVNIRRKISKMFRQNFARLLARELLLLLTPSKIDPAERLLVCCQPCLLFNFHLLAFFHKRKIYFVHFDNSFSLSLARPSDSSLSDCRPSVKR